MKQVAQNYRSGELSVVDVPPPACQPGGVLVRSVYSLISTGTEVMKVKEAKLSLAGKARARPEQVRQVIDTVAQQGPVATYKKVMNRLDSFTPLGYSLSGVVTDIGAGADEFKVGQLVACAGNEFALHSEVNWVPTNLCVPIPDGVSPKLAAFATVGAIAMHGVRRCEAQLGDTACVIGLGLVGQLVVQLLVASGVLVVGLDPVADRCTLAEQAGALACAPPTPEGLDRIERCLAEVGSGLGADHVLLVAGGSSNEPVMAAARLARDRARVVDIGKLRLDLPWNAYYDKELDVRFSRSYGPGRYDKRYEIEGIDYPPGYVRWTERRNLACFLDLVARGALDVEALVSDVFPLEDAVDVYDRLSTGALRGVGFLFEYPSTEELSSQAKSISQPRPATDRPPEASLRGTSGRVRVGFIGAGNYASSMLLPILAQMDNVELRHVATTRSLTALNAQRRFGFVSVGTDSEAVLADPSVDAVFVVTRHHSHADLTCRALEAGKTVFVEKPLALSSEELRRVLDVVAATGNDRLMVGFNRRFAPMLVEMRARFGNSTAGTVARYSVNAGTLGSQSWYVDETLEGSRFAGEGGHFIDTVSWWLGARPTEVYTLGAKDTHDTQVNLRFDDGSIATIAYYTNGNSRYPKETFEISAAGRTARLDNFRRAQVWSGRHRRVSRRLGRGGQRSASAARALHRRRAHGGAYAYRFALARCDHPGHLVRRDQPSERPPRTAVKPDRLRWYARRLASMPPSEVAWRLHDATWQRTWAFRKAPSGTASRRPRPPRRPGFTAVLPPDTRAEVPAGVGEKLVKAVAPLLEGSWEFLGVRRTDLAAPDWYLDPVTGRRAPQAKRSFRIDTRSKAETGNVKQVWELSRHQHLTLLAAAWFVTGDEPYATLVADQLQSWWQENPFLYGVNWTSGIEVGLRLISWVWIRRLLDGWVGVAALFEQNDAAIDQIFWHQKYLAALESRGSSANNHVIAEAAGQLIGSCAFPWFAQSGQWRVSAAALLERELRRNTFPSGINREQATDYQGFTAELGILAAVEASAGGHALRVDTWERLCLTVDASAALLDESMRAPRQGDSDEGRALLVDPPDTNRWMSLLAVGASLFGPAPWGPSPEASLLSTLLGSLTERPRTVRGRASQRPSHFADAGLTLLRTQPGPQPELWCRCDAGPHGYLSLAAHAHADALSIEVRYGGIDILADPGTYCYHGEPEWRRYFRSTLGHNTIELAEQDQSVSGGPFLWVRHAETNSVALELDEGKGVHHWAAEHDGYRTLEPPAWHLRSVQLDRHCRRIDVADHIKTVGHHAVRMAFHLGPAVSVELDGIVAQLRWHIGAGDGQESATMTLPSSLHWSMHRGEYDPILGWYSDRFGVKVPTTTLLGAGHCNGEALELRSSIQFAT